MYGKWIVKEVAVFDMEVGMKMVPAEEILASDSIEMEQYKQLASSVLVLSEDGTANTYLQIPEEMLAEAEAQGMPVTEYGVMVDSKELKVENGEFFYNTGNEGDIGGEAVDPFVKLELDDEGCFTLMQLLRYKRAE